jgi:hypothetical protein
MRYRSSRKPSVSDISWILSTCPMTITVESGCVHKLSTGSKSRRGVTWTLFNLPLTLLKPFFFIAAIES